jgi:hypothetical protein
VSKLGYVTHSLFLIVKVCTVQPSTNYCDKREPRPSEGQTCSLELQGMTGQKLIVRNFPGSFILQAHTNALMLSLLLGYDETLCPDARVVGDVADESYQPYSQEEREYFVQKHREEVQGRKRQANLLLQSLTETDDKVE